MAGDGFVLMQLRSLKARLPDETAGCAAPDLPLGVALRWSSGVERSRADFVRLHAAIDDEMGQDPEVFDSTFGTDQEELTNRMGFLYLTATAAAGAAAAEGVQPEPEPEPEPLAVGTCTAWQVGGTGWIHSLVIDPAYQGRGLSKHLLGAALRRLRELGHKSAMLAVRPASHRAITLYQRWGFKPVLEDAEDRQMWTAACTTAAGDRVAGLALPADYGARATALFAAPERLSEHNAASALCGMSAVLYGALVQSPAVVANLFQRLFAVQPQSLVVRCLRLMEAKPRIEVTQQAPAPAVADLAARELDFVLCRGLGALLEAAEPDLFASQLKFLSEEFPAEHGFHADLGDLALLADGVEGILRALHGELGTTWSTINRSALATAADLFAALCHVGRSSPGAVILAGRLGDPGTEQPELDHWFVVHGLTVVHETHLSGSVWNYAGHAGAAFALEFV